MTEPRWMPPWTPPTDAGLHRARADTDRKIMSGTLETRFLSLSCSKQVTGDIREALRATISTWADQRAKLPPSTSYPQYPVG
jgi:hypothetical protein